MRYDADLRFKASGSGLDAVACWVSDARCMVHNAAMQQSFQENLCAAKQMPFLGC